METVIVNLQYRNPDHFKPDERYIESRCMICHEDTHVRHINMYLIGSEGLDCCNTCEMKIIDFCRQLSHTAIIKRKQRYIEKKKQREQDELSKMQE